MIDRSHKETDIEKPSLFWNATSRFHQPSQKWKRSSFSLTIQERERPASSTLPALLSQGQHRGPVEIRNDYTTLLLLIPTKQSLLHPQVTFLVRRGPGKWSHSYLLFLSFELWSVSEFLFLERGINTCLNYSPRRYRSGESGAWLPNGLLSVLGASRSHSW